MNNEVNNTFKMGLQGKYKVAVVDARTEQEIWRQPDWGKNLILNQGLDALVTFYLAEVCTYGIAGTGTKFNSIDSGDSNGSVSGTTFTLSPGATGIQDLNSTTYGGWVGGVLQVGDIIQFANSTEVKVVSSIGATTATITPAGTVGSQAFTIWKTSQTGLQTEIKRAGTGIAGSSYLVGVGNCGSTITGNQVAYRRTYDFISESVPINYTEVGVAWDTDNTPIFSTFARVLLPQTVSIDSGQKLRLIYELQATFTPSTPAGVLNASVAGWPVAPSTNTNMSQSVQQILASSINTSGVSTTTNAPLEPPSVGTNCAFWGSTNSQSLQVLGSPVNRNAFGAATLAGASTKDSYTSGSFLVFKNATFALGSLNNTNIRSFGFGANNGGGFTPYGTNGQAFTMVFEQSQSKFSTQTLTMTYKWLWSRTLSD